MTNDHLLRLNILNSSLPDFQLAQVMTSEEIELMALQTHTRIRTQASSQQQVGTLGIRIGIDS